MLEFSLIVAMPFNGILLSDFGADVVKVEPLTGDPYRSAGAIVPGEGKRFQSLNRGKRSLAIDLSTARGRSLLYRILPTFDVVTINYRPGVAERLGLDYEALSQRHPALIYANLSGFGPRGPLSENGATDLAAAGYSGLIVGNGNVGASGEPRGLVPPIADYMTGTAIGMAICAALLHRERSGEGQLIEGSLLQSALAIQDVYVMRQPVPDASMRDPLMEDVNLLRQRGASYVEQLARRSQYRDTGASPSHLYYRGYVARDGAIVLGCLTRATRDGARQVLGMSHDLSDHPDYDSTDPATAEETDRCAREIEQQIRQRPVEHWLRIFAEAGVPVAPVRFPEEVADDPHIEAMGIMVDLEHELTGPQRVVGPLVSMSQTPLSARRASPALGSQTSEILREAGITPTDIQELFARRVVSGA